MPVGLYLVGGSQGRGSSSPCYSAFARDPKTGASLSRAPSGCVLPMSRNIIKTNDWYYISGNVNSTTGSAVTGGSLAARKRRT